MTNPATHNTQSTPLDSIGKVLAQAIPADPEIDAANFASPSALLSAFITGEIKPPCWIRAGHARFKVTDGNVRDFTRGMLLAVEMEALR